jgi:hypothetical protein
MPGSAAVKLETTIGERLRPLRQSHGMSLRALAERADLSAGALSQRPGDAYEYASTLPHRWRNIGKTPTVVVSACTPSSV